MIQNRKKNVILRKIKIMVLKFILINSNKKIPKNTEDKDKQEDTCIVSS